VNAASAFDVIVVGPGYYNETVYVGTQNLTIMGAQAGSDARERRYDPSKESIVDASGTPYGTGGGAGFAVAANHVVIDGFTIQGGTAGGNASGILSTGGSTQILNNIIQNNAVGVYFYGAGSDLVEYNAFKTNNAGAAGSSEIPFVGLAGFGIAGYESNGAAITENEFKGNLAAAIDYVNGGAEVTKNTSKNDGSFLVLYGSGFSPFSQNQGQDFGAQGFLPLPLTSPSGHADAAVDVGLGCGGLQINGNDLEEGVTSNYNGIAFTTIFGEGLACGNCHVTNNKIKRFAGNGIVAEESSGGVGTLANSGISGNDVEDNGNDGILLQQLGSNFYNTLVDNEAEGNSVNDCEDDTYMPPVGPGSGTAETYNTWFNNVGRLSVPAGLCAPGKRH
jgi:hypothetical protein